jgi:ribonucleoside-triphosphate reductase (thioredoxin)
MIDEYVFRSKYARFNQEKGRRESWEEAVDRMMDMHLRLRPQLHDEIAHCRTAIKSKKVTGSQRALQFGGSAIEKKNMRMYNCTSSYADRPRFFSEALWLLLCGCGVGFSVQRFHVSKLPDIREPGAKSVFVVPDTIEGWAQAVDALFNAYMKGDSEPDFDFSGLRAKGAPLRFGGKAPGPEPLQRSLEHIERTLRKRMYTHLRSIDVFDCVMHLADCVLSGGVRRAATIATFDVDDELMLNAKVGNWFETHPHRGRANISAVITPETPKAVFKNVFGSTKEFGEPGFVFFESPNFTVNPCSEILMCPVLIEKEGEVVEHYTKDLLDPTQRGCFEDVGYSYTSGWQACNLSTINASKLQTPQDLIQAAECAATIGTIQASYTDTGYLGSVSQRIIEREALIGVSICGIMDSPDVCLNDVNLQKAARTVDEVNAKVAAKLGIRRASRTTCIKPEGTTSLVLGSASGIHAHHARRYIRRVNASSDEPIFQAFAEQNPHAVEESVWGADKVALFAMESPSGALVKSDLDALGFMRHAKSVQQNWVQHGCSLPQRLEGAHHNVSITVTVKETEWVGVQGFLWNNRHIFCGVAFLGVFGDYDYPQAPLQAIRTPSNNTLTRAEELAYELWNTLRDKTKSVNYDQVFEVEDLTRIVDQIACGGGVCEII